VREFGQHSSLNFQHSCELTHDGSIFRPRLPLKNKPEMSTNLCPGIDIHTTQTPEHVLKCMRRQYLDARWAGFPEARKQGFWCSCFRKDERQTFLMRDQNRMRDADENSSSSFNGLEEDAPDLCKNVQNH
jgi:hypothetical protein